MKQFKSFVAKEFIQISRDKRTLLILLVMPIMLVLVLGYAITTELREAKVAVLDPSKDAETQRIKERFRASKYFALAKEVDGGRQADEVFRQGEADLLIVFGEHFADNLRRGSGAAVQLIADGTDPNQAAAAAHDTRERQQHTPIVKDKLPGRNDPCPCGSGKKFKNCHGRGLV